MTPYTVKIHEGIIWVYMNPSASEDDLPSIPSSFNNEVASDMALPKNKRQLTIYDFQIDLPYDHSYLVENLIDPAHIPISHDRTSGGGKREVLF